MNTLFMEANLIDKGRECYIWREIVITFLIGSVIFFIEIDGTRNIHYIKRYQYLFLFNIVECLIFLRCIITQSIEQLVSIFILSFIRCCVSFVFLAKTGNSYFLLFFLVFFCKFVHCIYLWSKQFLWRGRKDSFKYLTYNMQYISIETNIYFAIKELVLTTSLLRYISIMVRQYVYKETKNDYIWVGSKIFLILTDISMFHIGIQSKTSILFNLFWLLSNQAALIIKIKNGCSVKSNSNINELAGLMMNIIVFVKFLLAFFFFILCIARRSKNLDQKTSVGKKLIKKMPIEGCMADKENE